VRRLTILETRILIRRGSRQLLPIRITWCHEETTFRSKNINFLTYCVGSFIILLMSGRGSAWLYFMVGQSSAINRLRIIKRELRHDLSHSFTYYTTAWSNRGTKILVLFRGNISCRNQNSIVAIATRQRPAWRRYSGSIPWYSKTLVSLPSYPDWLFSSQPPNGWVPEALSQKMKDRSMKLNIYLHSMPRIRRRGALPPLQNMSSWRVKGALLPL
jgi:hypothetical protein